MSFAPTSPVTGTAQTGLTSPTYTIVLDTPPNAHSKQYAVTALGGTQTGVSVHSVSSPFTLTMERPSSFRQLGTVNPSTGYIANVPFNVFKFRVRKGVEPATGQPIRPAVAELKISIPAGADTVDDSDIRAMLSLLFGAASQQSAGIGDTVLTGTL